MRAEILAIGTELTSGAKLDTNSQWLSLQLADLGIPVLFHTTVADDLQANSQALQLAIDRVDLVLLTGGLGPTRDDLTRYVMADAVGEELVLDEASLAHIQGFFASRGREMPERNNIQAKFPQGSIPLANPIGTAPGIWMKVQRPGREPCLVAAFPGVPSEMHKMFLEQVRHRLPGGKQVIRRARINCFGIGESATEELLGDLTERGRDPEVGITAHEATITLRIIAHGASEQECQQKIDGVTAEIHRLLPEYVFGCEDEELEDIVVRELIARGQTLATIEIATHGQLCHRFAQVAGAVQCFREGKVLTEEQRDLTEVSETFRQERDVDYVLAIGAERFEQSPEGFNTSIIPLRLVGENLCIERELTWSGNPNITQSRTSKTAIDLLRRHLFSL